MCHLVICKSIICFNDNRFCISCFVGYKCNLLIFCPYILCIFFFIIYICIFLSTLLFTSLWSTRQRIMEHVLSNNSCLIHSWSKPRHTHILSRYCSQGGIKMYIQIVFCFSLFILILFLYYYSFVCIFKYIVIGVCGWAK